MFVIVQFSKASQEEELLSDELNKASIVIVVIKRQLTFFIYFGPLFSIKFRKRPQRAIFLQFKF